MFAPTPPATPRPETAPQPTIARPEMAPQPAMARADHAKEQEEEQEEQEEGVAAEEAADREVVETALSPEEQGALRTKEAVQAVVQEINSRERLVTPSRPTPPQSLPSIRAGLNLSAKPGNKIWKKGSRMKGGEDLASGFGSSQVWLPRGDHSMLSPRAVPGGGASLRNSSSLTMAVALIREHQRRMSRSVDEMLARSQASLASTVGLGTMDSQASSGTWLGMTGDGMATDGLGSGAATESSPRLVWRCNSGSVADGFGCDTGAAGVINGRAQFGSVTSEESRQRLEAARIIVDERRRQSSRQGSRVLSSRGGREPPKTLGTFRSPRLPLNPRQAFGVVQHTVRDWGGSAAGKQTVTKLREAMVSPSAVPKLPHTARTSSTIMRQASDLETRSREV